MLKLSKKIDYGLIAVSHIAGQMDDQTDRIVNAKHIAEQYNIPSELLAKVLQKLAKGGGHHQSERPQGRIYPG